MQLIIMKNNDQICLMLDADCLEEYKMSESITFDGLMSFLLKQDLKEKINIEVKCEIINDQEKTLINLISEIVDNYNKKVDEFLLFISKNDNSL